MNFNEQVALTLRIASHGRLGNWRAFVALAGMIVMIGGMVAMMWFLSAQATSDPRGWVCGALSVAGLALWRAMLPGAAAEDQAGR
jgi:hypothetical protein